MLWSPERLAETGLAPTINHFTFQEELDASAEQRISSVLAADVTPMARYTPGTTTPPNRFCLLGSPQWGLHCGGATALLGSSFPPTGSSAGCRLFLWPFLVCLHDCPQPSSTSAPFVVCSIILLSSQAFVFLYMPAVAVAPTHRSCASSISPVKPSLPSGASSPHRPPCWSPSIRALPRLNSCRVLASVTYLSAH